MLNIDDIIKPAKFHRTLDGFALAQARGVPQKEFAEKCGWSQQYQAQLEHGENEISLATAETITRVLTELNEKGLADDSKLHG
jgi:transcriptional regulator with XRE-family HTH domain